MTQLLVLQSRRFLLALLLVLACGSLASFNAEAATSAEILAEVKEQAVSDANTGQSMRSSVIADRYRHNNAGLSTTLISIIYTREYKAAQGLSRNPEKVGTKAAAKAPSAKQSEAADTEESSFQWPTFDMPELNSAGVLTPLLLVLLLVIIYFSREILLDLAGRIVAITTNLLPNRGQVRHRSGRRLLKAYRRVILRSYGDVKLFRPEHKPMDMISDYIGLRLRGLPDEEAMKLEDAVQHYRRLLILGAPGSGKSLALQRLALGSADPRLPELPENALPILLPLHRMNGAPMPLRKMMALRLRHQKVRGAAALVNRGLLEGNVILLLDGLDEVSQYDRNHVLVDIKTLLGRFPDVRCVITCRKSSYHNELRGVVDATGELMGLDNAERSRLAHGWAGSIEDDTHTEDGTSKSEDTSQTAQSANALLAFITATPALKSMSHNPMMMTIMAFIRGSTQTLNVATRSRYLAEGTDILLARDIGENQRFSSDQKAQLLAHLARLLQDRGAREGADLFSLHRKEALLEVASALPRLTKASEARALVDEIITQSGLLWLINGGTTLKFAHPALQHYFAAASLLDNAEGLLIRYRSDPDAWRESVKIWCGLVDDAEKVIETVLRLEPNTAVACRAEAGSAAAGLPPDMLDKLIS